MNVSFPEKKGTDKDLKFNNQFGKYLISNFNTWHGGIHIEGRNNPIQAIADGRIIAYRLAEDYELLPQTQNVTSRKGESTEGKKPETRDYKYSNSFILVQHDLELSKEVTENKGQEYELTKQEKKNITFYSLYNHLMPLNEIQNNNLKYPDFFATEAIKVTSNEGYEGSKKTKINGLNARTLTNGKIFPLNKGAIKFVIPEGETATIYKNAQGEIPEEIDGYARVIYNGHNDIYVNTKTKFVTKISDTYKIIYKHDSEEVDNENSLSEEEKNKKGARVRKEAKSKTEIVDIIPNGEIVQVIEKSGANSKWYKIKGYEGGYSHSSNFKETNTFDESKITKNDIIACDIPLKSGQNIGYTGLLASESNSTYSACQLDVFMAEGVEDFLSNTFKAGANKKDFITVPQGTTLKKSITIDVDLKKEESYKVLQVNGTFAQIKVNRDKTQKAVKRDLLGKYVSASKNSHYLISSDNFDAINKAFKNQLPIGTDKLYWFERAKSDGTVISKTEEANLKKKDKAYVEYRKVEFRPEATDAKKTYWVNLDDLLLKVKVVTKKTKKRIPKSIEDYSSVYEWFTADDRYKEIEHEYQIPEVKNAGKGEITKLNKDLKLAYLAVPEKPEDCDEILEKEAIANIKSAKTTPDGEWIEVTCTCPIGSEYLVQKGWIENNLTPFSPFNWNRFGFNTFEAGEEYIYDIKDIYDSQLTTSNFTKTLWAKIDSLKGKDHGLIDQKELKLAYRTLETQFYVAKMVCNHKTEWSYTPQEIANEVTTLYDYYINLEPEETKADLEKLKEKKLEGLKGQVEKLMFWNELQGVAYTPENNTEAQEEETTQTNKTEAQETTPLKQTETQEQTPMNFPVGIGTFNPSLSLAQKFSVSDNEPDINQNNETQKVEEKEEEEIIIPERNLPSASNLWHFHPIAFVNQMKLMFSEQEITGVCMGEARVRAFLRMLRVGEGTVGDIGYTKLFGGDNFTESPHNKDISSHPKIKVYWYTDKNGKKVHSSAAGAYQVMGYSWDDKKMVRKRKEYAIKDFSPLNQDYFAIIILKYKRPGLINLIIKNQIKKGLEDFASYEWASLPPGRYGQPAKTMAEALKLYNSYLKEELKGESDLHLKAGFLKKFGINCCSEDQIYDTDTDTDNVITIVRKWENWTGTNSNSTTISSFSISSSTIEGYIAEPHGEETAESGKDKRIPVGTYSLVWHISKNFPLNKYVSKGQPILQNGFPKLYNDTVSKGRGILVHIGNTGKDSEGCLLPGSGLKEENGKITGNTGSTSTFYDLIDYIEEKGIENVKIVIEDEIN